ncbi:hypothetical protein A3K93_05660 [Acinetobacter sp. NCu2D-2]|uniref:YgjP family zinc-dependent metalloprotease n=1 Tax=Acinetobacter sp. NCu2D-2 TaxID=1608473 RepID=UPI0007CDB35B|nr:SprT family zinc-dependent metalloprotease [Acinetobacter sp. NCu2D-2]ANF81721.1 hypothetical protein A3K93_05660 [Acinetobacter sp. NCu2D-2]
MTLSQLPEIQITRNLRSTRLRLRIDGQQIKLTAPVFCTQRQIQNFIQQSEGWIIKTWQAQQQRVESIERILPSEIQLFDRSTAIQTQYNTQKQNYIYDDVQNVLTVSTRQPEIYLKQFVIEYAKQVLPLYLKAVSEQIGLNYQQCKIRQPKTRWGSCSAKHDIMLNSGIVLFQESVVRYLCVHELAHTRHFDHSARFWALVQQFDPNHKIHRQLLKNTPLPYWWNES